MLQAMLKDGTLVTLADYSREEIHELRNAKQFFCPSCHEPVIVKVGRKVIPHFAHKRLDKCSANLYGEGPEHERGKLLLYEWLKHQRMNVMLEKYLPDIEQIPDLLLTINGRKIAIEYQRAQISKQEINERTTGYLQAGITPIWILGENQFHRLSANSLKITPMLKQFIHKFSLDCLSSMFFFCPHTMQFVFFQDIYFTSNNRALGTFQFHSLKRTSFLQFFQYQSFSKHTLFNVWMYKKKIFRLRHHGRTHGRERKWLQWLYLRKTHRELLSPIVYLPVRNQLLMASSLWDWQSRLVIDLIQPLSKGDTFLLEDCFHLLRNHLSHRNKYPLYTKSDHPLVQYLYLLEKCTVIRRVSTQKYVKLKSIEFTKNIEDAIINDKLLMNTLMQSTKHTITSIDK